MGFNFKVGDLVEITTADFEHTYAYKGAYMPRGSRWTVKSCNPGALYLDGYPGFFSDPQNWVLVTTTSDTKASNPKDVIGDTKLDYSVIPSTVLAYLSTAFFEGAAKYGKLNWRHSGVRGSVYTNALERHLQKYIGGEFVDPETGVPHLASVMACAGIILDAGIHGKLTDDRPDESKESVELIPVCADIQQKLKAMHKDKKPIHYTRDRDNGTN